MPRLCQPCQALNLQRSEFISPPWLPEERRNQDVCTRTFRDLRQSRSECDLCAIIWHALEKSDSERLSSALDEDKWSVQWAQNTFDWQPDDETDGVEDKFGSALYPCFGEGENSERQDYGIQLIDEADTDGFLRGRLIGDEVDPSLLRSWIRRCKDLHGENCAPSFLQSVDLDVSDLLFLTLIDVRDDCLRDLPASGADKFPYVTLSYVWGKDNHTVALKANVEQMYCQGGLKINLPRTIQDAIEDDDATKQAVVGEMDVIYSNADVTLVAATSDGAESGLSGWSSQSARPQSAAQYGKDVRLGTLPYYQRELLGSSHAHRAWTYQETCLSPRCLVFLNGKVYFDCHKSVWAEQVHAEVDGIEPETSANTFGKSTLGTPLQMFSQHVRAYTSRALTYQSDGLNAFSGIMDALPSMLTSDSRYALPMSCLDWALLWRPAARLVRRQWFPSWSWVGWQGEIQMSQDTHTRYDQVWLLQGTWIEWYQVRDDGGCCLITSHGVDFSPRAREVADALRRGQAVPVLANDQHDDSDVDSDGGDCIECPTYANECTADPFGRYVHLDSTRLLPSRPYSKHTYRSCTPRGNGLLCFAAPFFDTQADANDSTAEEDAPFVVSLLDRTGRRCGSISIDDCDSWISSTRTVKLLILSVTSYGDLSHYHGSGLTCRIFHEYGVEDDLDEYIEDGPEGLNRFDFLNVLYIVETERKVELRTTKDTTHAVVHERAGIGFIYREALRHVGEVSWADFVLG